MAKIMLDAGHYGDYNRSPAYQPYWESRAMWKLCNLLSSALEKYGIEVSKTRSKLESDLELYYRGAKSKGYDMFISLHSNAVGASVNDSVDHPVVYRLTSDKEKGEKLALEIAEKIASVMGTKQNGRTATKLQSNGNEYYGVLRGAAAVKCPHAFIIEHSFHTATKPAMWLSDDGNLKLLAEEEAAVIAEFFGLKGEDEMTAEEKKKLSELENKVKALEEGRERVYHYYDELPDYARDVITSLHINGVFKGSGPDDMNLPESLMRMLIILASAGVLKA